MQSGSVEGAKVPENTPDQTNTASRIEHGPPSEMSDDERAHGVRQSDADAEP